MSVIGECGKTGKERLIQHNIRSGLFAEMEGEKKKGVLGKTIKVLFVAVKNIFLFIVQGIGLM